MILFVKLLLAHLIGDFILQPTSWVVEKEQKKHKSIYLWIHILLHGILAWLMIREIRFIWFALMLAASHGLIDVLKLHFQKPKTKRSWFIADQLMHVATLMVITIIYTGNPIDPSIFNDRFWMVFTGVILLTKPASIIIKNIISIWTPESSNNTDSLINAGNYIGILERLFVFCFIITGHFDAVGFLLGAKSIFRFGDLMQAKERKLTEYVLIGTLLSFGLAMLTGFLVNYCLLLMA
ncbi:DUF3307 domain-containing protein [Flavobacterium pallidum]|uniref:DUF3307 domain-containing protein n=1 Tax=Flavobacterium pallidum TaxID=2172098 RepID=A0A2S1SIE0_9FLAO|nr:DUF3307 domain-containing protein [Flavobacterium pallidum]AWI26160.1 DUF3307 domain-containing protein [Flavobacterium pallidum]